MIKFILISLIVVVSIVYADWIFGPEGFDDGTIIIVGSSGSPLYWFAPDYHTPMFVYSPGFASDYAIGSGEMSWTDYWGNFIRTPLVDCSSSDSVFLSFRMWNTADPGDYDYARFYVWVEPTGYFGTTTVNMHSGDARDWELMNIDFTEYAAGQSEVYFYLEANFGTGSFTRECKFDNIGVVSGIDLSIEETASIPLRYSLSAHPNPFNSSVKITVGEGLVPSRVEIFDINGRMVAEIPDYGAVGDGSPVPSSNGRGDHAPTEVVWTPNKSLGSGIYLVRARFDGAIASRRIVYLK